MKIRVANPIRLTLRRLSRAVDPSTGHRHQYEAPAVLKRRVPLDELLTTALGHDPETHMGELRWHCFMHPDSNPSLWCRPDHSSGFPRWGCNVCGVSGDVFDFLERHPDYCFTFAEAEDWVKKRYPPRLRVRLRMKA